MQSDTWSIVWESIGAALGVWTKMFENNPWLVAGIGVLVILGLVLRSPNRRGRKRRPR